MTIVQELQAKGVQPNTAAYNALIKAFGTGLQFHAVSTPQPYPLLAVPPFGMWLSVLTLLLWMLLRDNTI